MSAYPINTETAELLSQRYGLRACEIVDKTRFLDCNRSEHTINIRGKGDSPRDIHILPSDYDSVIKWYNNPETMTRQTLYNRIGPTHQGRRDRYKCLPKDAGLEAYIATGEELGHTPETAIKHYNRARIEQKKKDLLKHLPK